MKKETKKQRVNSKAVDFQLKLLKAKRNGFMLGLFIGLGLGIIATLVLYF